MTDCEIRDLEQTERDLQSNNERLLQQHNDRKAMLTGLIVYAIAISLSVIVSLYQTEQWKGKYQDLQKQLIERNLQQFNPTNAVREWVTPK